MLQFTNQPTLVKILSIFMLITPIYFFIASFNFVGVAMSYSHVYFLKTKFRYPRAPGTSLFQVDILT